MVALISMWSMCSSQEEIDVYEAYGTNFFLFDVVFTATQEALFSLKIHYAGCFPESPGIKYVNGDFAFFDCIDIDEFFCAQGNDDDVRIMSEYIRLGYKMIEVYIEHDKTTVSTYIEAAYNTPSKKCMIMEYPEGNNAPQTKLKPRRAVLGNYAKKLLLGWKENDANEIYESSTRHEDGESSQSKTTTNTTQTKFATDFYTTGDPLMGQDFVPFFGLDSAPIDATNTPTTKADCVGKGKRIALDDGQVYVSEYVDWNEAAENENRDRDGSDSDSDGYSSESDGLVDEENELVDVEVDMDGFDRANDNTMGNEGTTEFNANEDFDIGIKVVDNDEFESASDEEGIDSIRTRKLKQLMKQNQINEGGLHKTRRELFLKKNDKVRLRAECRGTIPVFHANSKVGSSQVVGPSQTVGPSKGSQTKWTKGKIATSKGIESPLITTKHTNTTVRIGVESKADHTKPTRVFKRIYVCLGASKEGFKACMRQFLSFDGTFMRGPFPGQLLTTVGVDPNNGIYLGLWCCGNRIKGVLDLKAASALTVPHFEYNMEKLKAFNKDCYDWLAKIPPVHWARICLTSRAKTDMLLNNICEVFNGKLVDGRDRPIISTLKYAREYLMKRIVTVKQVIERSDGPLTPSATRLFDVIKAQASECKAEYNGGHLYRVTGPWGEVCVVDVQNRSCTCRKWEITGFPCKHAVASNWNMAANRMEVGLPESWVHPCYRLETWKQVYSHHINPIRGKIMWPKCPIPTTILPPNQHPQVGRPTKARKKSDGEDIKMVNNGKLSRKSKTVTWNKRPRSETSNGNAQPAKKGNTNVTVGVQTRSKAASQGSQLTTSGRKSVTKGKKKA
ncbi:mutator type transposase [Tanacetum coccineum]